MADGITITGLDDCLRFCDKAPGELLKVCREAMKEGGKASKKMMRDRLPKRWKRLAQSKVSKSQDGKLNAGFGLYNKHQQSGKQPRKGASVDDWFKAYWKNYGTLTKRDPSHQFDRPIRGANQAVSRRRRNNVGQPAERFFEAATHGYEDTFVEAFENYLEQHIDECYGK